MGERYMSTTKVRNSNYELMRIVSMFLIVLYHVIYHGQVLQNCHNEGAKIILELLEFFIFVYVNSLILLSVSKRKCLKIERREKEMENKQINKQTKKRSIIK